jgi:serine/threonine-protein kinase HSL1 (negative regulator of Swe1 kinase)
MNVSKTKGRKEVYKTLREWKQYGMEDVRLDKSENIVYGRVGEGNCKPNHPTSSKPVHLTANIYGLVLRLRPVEFSAEFYTVLEHGRQANISVIMFRQERGAASSFTKVVDTLETVLRKRGLTVEDPARAKKMTKVLDHLR